MTGLDTRIVVVGAGLSGLAAAHRLQEAGCAVTVLEQSPVVGGCAATRREGGYTVDTGCDLINGTYARYLRLVEELGLDDRLERASGVADFIRDGRALSVDPTRPHTLLASPLLTRRSKLVAALGLARLAPLLRRFDAYALARYDADAYGTGPELVRRHFNDEIGSRVLDPLVRAFTGTGLQHASGLAVLAALAVGTAPGLAVRGGMTVVPDALAARMDVRWDSEAIGVEEHDDGVTVRFRDADGTHELTADGCVLALSYAAAAGMWPALADATPGLGARLRDLALISVSVGYDAASPTAAYGVLVPTRESREALLILMQQNKSPDRVPAGRTMATIFTDASVTASLLDRSDAELTDWAGGILEGFYPSLRGRRELSVVSRWRHTGYMPFPGFYDAIAETRGKVERGRVHTTSALFGSGGVEHAVVGGERAAKRALAALGPGRRRARTPDEARSRADGRARRGAPSGE